ncbi:hypothetical protein GPX89_17150 [Nocardia sp. ET3-3]|uniref:Uncharacterized protein n=1 Tax=Nocardia terrae TaxID=2675851 RepID=A0A7K1UXK8_9NOCA|nr:DUF6585 family protein [Nocardia terrae]MVU78967.1 hypothetical protein [Nocardia terrae]
MQIDDVQRISEAAARAGLGRHVKTYEAVRTNWRAIGKLGIAFVVLVAVTVLGYAVQVEILEAAVYFALITGLAALFSTVRGLYTGQQNSGKWLELFEHGLIFKSKERLRVVRYDSTSVIQDLVDHRRNGVTTRVTHAYQIRDLDGQALRLREGIINAQEWGPRIQEGVAAHQMPTALATLGSGSPVEFGSITLSPTGVSGYGTLVRWTEITDVDVAEGRLRIKTAAKRPPIVSPISSLTNFNLLYALIERGRGSGQR